MQRFKSAGSAQRFLIDAEIDRLALSLRRRSAVRRMVLPAAFSAGQEAGERFEYRPGIERG